MPAARRPIAELLRLALPTVAQMASYTVMQFIDTWILSRLGETAATAAGNSGMLCFALIGLGVGTLVIVNTLASQSFGRGDFAECGRYMWQGIWLGLLYGLALLPLRALGGPLFRAFGHPADMAAMEAAYWKIVILSAAMKLVSTTVGQFLLSVDRPNYVLISAVAGVSMNAVAAWAMVLGHLGIRSMGIAGAAWAQNIGVCCEMLTLLVLSLRIPRKFGALHAAIRPAQMATLIRVGLPSGLQLFSDVLAWSVFCNSVVGLLGSAAMAANTFMLRYLVVSFMPVIGLQTAVTALVGRYIGRRQPDIAQRRAHLAFSVALIYIVICWTIFVLARRPLMQLFTRDPQVIRIGSTYLICAAIYELFDAMYIIYSGALRGAGDTLAPMVVMASLCWTISIGGGYLMVWWTPRLYCGPWIAGCLYGVALGVYMIWRFLRGGWREIRLGANSNVELASATLAST